MFSLRLQEVPIPTTDRDLDGLCDWFVETFSLVRKRGDETSDFTIENPVHSLLRDYLFAQSNSSFEAQMLADELSLTPASLNHHLTRLVQAGLIGYSNEGKGWRRYYLKGGSLENAVESLASQCRIIVSQRLALLEHHWERGETQLEIELPEQDRPPLSIGITEARPHNPESGMSEISQWMMDFGLLGERPGKEILADSLSVRLFELMLSRGLPLSLDEAAEAVNGPKPRIGRILERFRACGLVERVPRTDRLSFSLWQAMTTQYQRRGEDWMLKKGGFNRILNAKQQGDILKKLKKSNLRVEDLDSILKSVDAQQQMLLLNLLGGRLPLGHRIRGHSPDDVRRQILESLDIILRRMRRVAGMMDGLYRLESME